MTLVMSTSIGSAFTIITSDERIAYRLGDGSLKPIENESEIKVYKLTNKVLFGWGGNQELSHRVLKELQYKLNEDDGLEECKKVLEVHAEEMDPPIDFVVLLTGFYKNGTNGMLMYKGGKEIKEATLEEEEYQYAMLPPTTDYLDHQEEYFYIPEFLVKRDYDKCFKGLDYNSRMNKAVQIAIQQLYKIHAIISHKQPKEVTSSGCYYVIYRDTQGNYHFASSTFDTLEAHKHIV